MNDFGTGGNPAQTNATRRQLVITAQLYKAVESMNHIDELILWLAERFTGSFPVQVAQFWALRADRTRQTSVELRACICQDPTFPTQFVINNQVSAVVLRLLNGQYDNMFRPVENLFSSYQASTLSRFGLYYCACSFIRSEALLPPAYSTRDTQFIAVPLSIAVLLYSRQTLTHDTLSAIDLILGQAVSLAENRFLHLPGNTSSGRLPAVNKVALQPPSPLNLYELIPERNEDNKLLTASNPLSGTNVILDKRARRLYDAINGVRNIKEICDRLRIDSQEVYELLQMLAAQNRIRLYKPDGQLVDNSVFVDRFSL
ncbi:MAG TPA: hypothetical protein VKP04_02150 [Ktedonobacteraceae bacterium]|nr:hypothetical protein [Ktedonobacteraceae bacterium]